jgi:hypothetical protein
MKIEASRKLVAASVILLAVLLTGVAYAAFNLSISGNQTVLSATTSQITLCQVNGVNQTISNGNQSCTLNLPDLGIGGTNTISVTVKNTGSASASFLFSASSSNPSITTVTPPPGYSNPIGPLIIAVGTSQNYYFTVTALEAGTASVSVNVSGS